MRDVFSRRDFSDHLVLIRAYNAYQKADDKSKFCDSMYLSRQAMDMIKGIRYFFFWPLETVRVQINF